MKCYLPGSAPLWQSGIHFDSRANIIATNAKLQALRKITIKEKRGSEAIQAQREGIRDALASKVF
jgi:hypothetical protein